MAENVTMELMYEVIKEIRRDVGTLREDMDMVKLRLSSVEKSIGDLKTEVAGVNMRIDRNDIVIRSLSRFAQSEDAFKDQ